jgi:stringent starvation protein B
MASDATMTSNRPYLIRGLYEWITDNGLTPHVLADATADEMEVPSQAVKEGKVVLNLSRSAVRELDLGNDYIQCTARFGGVSQPVTIPVDAVMAVYARENGQGMLFPSDEKPDPPPDGDGGDDDDSAKKRSHLKVVK